MMANWLGGAFINRDMKGDPQNRKPIEVTPAKDQREALAFILENAFSDASYGITPELLQYMRLDKWWDSGNMYADATWPLHDRIFGIQSSVLTTVLNPTTLGRIYDNEYLDTSDDALTLPEVMEHVNDAMLSEFDQPVEREYSARAPFISSMRRNIQSAYLERLIDLSLPGAGGAVAKPVTDLARMTMRKNLEKVRKLMEAGEKLDPYTMAHLGDAEAALEKALDAEFIYNANQIGGGGGPVRLILGENVQN